MLFWLILNLIPSPCDGRAAGKPYTYWEYEQINTFFKKLAEDFPNLVEVWDAVEKWPDIARDKHAFPKCGVKKEDCVYLVVRIANETSLKPTTPEVYFCWNPCYGDERIGPNPQPALLLLY